MSPPRGGMTRAVGIRAVPIGEAMMALVLADHYMPASGAGRANDAVLRAAAGRNKKNPWLTSGRRRSGNRGLPAGRNRRGDRR